MTGATISAPLHLTAQPAAVAVASAWARACAAEHGLHADDCYRLDLCVSEWVENVTRYAYPAPSSPGSLSLTCTATAAGVAITVADTGFPFDPSLVPSPTPPASLTAASPGGLGVHLVRKFADTFTYQRDGERNVLTIEIRRQALDPASARTARGTDRRRTMDATPFPLTRGDGTSVAAEPRSGLDRRNHGFISSFRIFRDVPYASVENVLGSCPTREFSDGEVLLRPGDRNEYLALVLRGRLRIHLDAPDSDDFVEIAPGDCAGEMSLVDGRPVSAYVVAHDSCRLLLVDGHTFLTRLLALPGVARNMLSMLAERMRSSNTRALARAKSSIELAALQRELRLAHDIQSNMIPERFALTPARPELDCAGFMRAAREVGGDFYDAFYIEPNRLFVAIGDVCGKGMAAALLMVRAMMLLRAEASRPVPSQRQHTKTVMESVNRQLAEKNDNGYFASLLCGILDTDTGVLTFANAGHTQPVLVRGRAPVCYLEVPRNPIAGIVPGAAYAVGEVVLPPASTLLLYTDGLTEAENASGDMFGDARLLELFKGKDKRTASAVVEDTVRAVDAFAAGYAQSDDLTLLALVYHGDTAT
jgi:serine phosphatase RsbU (regulator of sigma subunit)/anti-sigma regulatory factor (Ser/Thr protein kinase)